MIPPPVEDPVLGRVIADIGIGLGAPAAALIENHNPVMIRIKQPAVGRGGAGAGSAVQKQHRLAFGVARYLPIHFMMTVEIEHP